MKKILIFISIMAVLITCAALSINAEEVSITDETVVTTVATFAEDIEAPDTPAELPNTDTEAAEDEIIISEAVKQFVDEHLAEIASILTVILSAVLTFMYKKGLLPVISAGFSKLVEMLNTFKGNIEDRVASFGEDTKPVIAQMNKAIDECTKMKESFDEIQKIFAAQEEQKKTLEDKIAESNARDILTCELLCQLLMCTNVPQYMKDKIATYYEQTKATIEKGEAVTSDEDVA